MARLNNINSSKLQQHKFCSKILWTTEWSQQDLDQCQACGQLLRSCSLTSFTLINNCNCNSS